MTEATDVKWTEGPWTIHEDPPSTYGDHMDHGGFRIDAGGLEQLAYVWNRSRRINPETDKQDGPEFGVEDARGSAHLIAAAPDLYAALEFAKMQLEAYENDLTGELYNSPLINVALAKARGDSSCT